MVKVPQVTPEWNTGIYIGNGKIAVKEFKDVAYFENFNDARDHGAEHGKGFPNWRVVSYGRGYAVQAYISGPYFNMKGELK